MANNNFTVEVKAKISIDRSTAEGCLKLVEMYMNEHNVCIQTEMDSDENTLLYFREVKNRKLDESEDWLGDL